jgi:ribonuclease P protein component
MLVVPGVVQDSRYKSVNAFSAAQRIPRSEGFRGCLQSAGISDQNFKIFFIRRRGFGARLGVIASKKNISRAVDRNRTKRAVKEAFRVHEIKHCPLDLVVMVRRAIQAKDRIQRDALAKLFNQLTTQCADF